MTEPSPIPNVFTKEAEAVNQTTVRPYIDRLVQRIHLMWLPGGKHFKDYMRYKWRMNHKSNTLRGSFVAVSDFLSFCSTLRKRQLQEIVRDDLEAYIEHLQDRGLKVTTVITRLKHLYAFLRYLIEQDIMIQVFSRERSNCESLIFYREQSPLMMSGRFSVRLKTQEIALWS